MPLSLGWWFSTLWRRYILSKCRALPATWYKATSQKSWTLGLARFYRQNFIMMLMNPASKLCLLRACTWVNARMILIIMYVSCSIWVVCALISRMNDHFLLQIFNLYFVVQGTVHRTRCRALCKRLIVDSFVGKISALQLASNLSIHVVNIVSVS